MKKCAPAFIITAGALWGTIGVFVRLLAAYGFDSLQLTALRAFVTAVVLLVLLLALDRQKLKIRWRDCWCFAGMGIASIVFFNICYFQTILLASLSIASILLYTAPVFVMLLSAFLFQERLTGQKLASLALAVTGCALVSGIGAGGAALSAGGLLTGLGAGFGYALYSIFGRFALARYHPLTVTAYTFLFASAGCLCITDLSTVPAVFSAHGDALLWVAAYGVVTSVAPYVLYTTGLRYVQPSRAAIMASVEPVVATLIGAAFYQEELGLFPLLGIVFVLAAVVLLNRRTKASRAVRDETAMQDEAGPGERW